MNTAERIAATLAHVETFTAAGRYDDARAAVACLADAVRPVVALSACPTLEAKRSAFCLRVLVAALKHLVHTHEVATNLRAAHAECLAELGPDDSATKGGAYFAGCATKLFERAGDEVRAMVFGFERGITTTEARRVCSAESVENIDA